VGVIYWQAPEVRAYVYHVFPCPPHPVLIYPFIFYFLCSGAYNPTKADIWSLGATIWEMAESTPPFNDAANAADLRDRWPPLTRAKDFSRSLHDFLTLCSNPVAARPDVSVLAQVGFILGGGRDD
jgi:p21-activated kinase 1